MGDEVVAGGPVRYMVCPQCGQETTEAPAVVYGPGVPQLSRCPWCGEADAPLVTAFVDGQPIWRGCLRCEQKLATHYRERVSARPPTHRNGQ